MSQFYLIKPSNFITQIEVSTVFMEFENKLLFLLRPQNEWSSSCFAIPGGKLEGSETPLEGLIREISEELSLEAKQEDLEFICSVYVRHSKVDYRLHLFSWKLSCLPPININPSEHEAFCWQSIGDVEKLPLLEGQLEAFHIAYKERLFIESRPSSIN